jgi:hypothetical protein
VIAKLQKSQQTTKEKDYFFPILPTLAEAGRQFCQILCGSSI